MEKVADDVNRPLFLFIYAYYKYPDIGKPYINRVKEDNLFIFYLLNKKKY